MTNDALIALKAGLHLRAGQLPVARALLRHALRTGHDPSTRARTLLGELCRPGRRADSADRPSPPTAQDVRLGLELGFAPGCVPASPTLNAKAEQHQQAGRYREAAQSWQEVAERLQEQTPESVYARLSEAMACNTQGFGGTREENRTWGDGHQHEVLSWLHAQLQTQCYLEIGVAEGLSLVRAPGRPTPSRWQRRVGCTWSCGWSPMRRPRRLSRATAIKGVRFF